MATVARQAWTVAHRGALEPLVMAARRSSRRDVIERDLARWYDTRLRFLEADRVPADTFEDRLRFCLGEYAEFRNVLYYRLDGADPASRNVARIARRLFRPIPSCEIGCPDVGPGLVIRHGFNTILSADRIGANCFVHHEVTIGWDEEGTRAPRLGDDVYIGTGAKVLGPITVGNGARVGANAVVVSDVPDGATVVGVPATVVRRRDVATQDIDAITASAMASVPTDGRSSPAPRRS
jgi:serine O-acetyltransferase